jgi:SAM-dependent methyltransferase
VCGYQPPLKFADDSFDALYSISVWSHFPEDVGMEWLREVKRVTKPGAILIITTAGKNVLADWREKAPRWKNVTDEEFEKEKYIYKEYLNLNSQGEYYPGISGEGSWGGTLLHPDYVREAWGQLFNIKTILEGGMNGMQDIVVMENNKG